MFVLLAGRATTSEELEDMLESGNPAIFTQGVSVLCMSLLNLESVAYCMNVLKSVI